MVYTGETFVINGIRFRKICNETVAGVILNTLQQCYDYAYSNSNNWISDSRDEHPKTVIRHRNGVPPKHKDLRY